MIISEYELQLQVSLTYLRFLLLQGLTFCGHDDSIQSFNRGNFLELLKWLGGKCEDVKKITFVKN